MGTVIDDLAGLPARIKTSAERVRELELMLKNERGTRDDLICSAVDEAGISQKIVAEHAGLSQPQVLRILAAGS